MNEYLSVITIFFSLVFGFQYAFQNKGVLCLKIISFQLILIAVLLSAFIFLKPALLIQYPHLFRVVSPLIYTLTPTAFLFHYYFLRPEKRFNFWFILLYIPFFIQIAENSKFYFLPADLKLKEIQLYFQNRDYFYHSSQYVWFPSMWHSYLKILQYIVFGGLMGHDIYLFQSGKLQLKPQKGSLVKGWLYGNFFFRLCTITFLIYAYIINFKPSISTDGVEFALALEVLFILLFLLFNPSLIDGHYFQEYLLGNVSQNKLHLQKGDSLTKDVFQTHVEEQQRILHEIDLYFARSSDFLQIDFTIEKLATAINVPQRFVSFSVKQIMDMAVKDYVNKKRIEYLLELYQRDPKIQKYSFDYMAELIGFRSRQSLYSSIAKFYNCTPKELFDQIPRA